MNPTDEADSSRRHSTIRCAFCLSLNRVDMARARDRPKCGSCGRPMLLDRPVRIEADDFDATVLGADVPVLVDFYADWCAPCRMVTPVLDEIALESVGELLVAKVDTDRAQEIAERYGIRSIPTLILFAGGAESERVVGVDTDGLRRMARTARSDG
ncbi:MAG: thioredoxin [Gemmatimonadetes bacterium]|nr:thioredoxin [Gemmatimonadota bacterium]NNF37227.1 thioredoxin [Gemmatimonadota bacterium]NNK63065.1 thioredoxin [Gemmatimonadota bacterium]